MYASLQPIQTLYCFINIIWQPTLYKHAVKSLISSEEIKHATVSTTSKRPEYSTFKLQTYHGILRDVVLHFLVKLTLGISKCVKMVIQRYTNLNNPGYWSKLIAPMNWIKQNPRVFMFHTQSYNYSTPPRTSSYFEALSQTGFKPSSIM